MVQAELLEPAPPVARPNSAHQNAGTRNFQNSRPVIPEVEQTVDTLTELNSGLPMDGFALPRQPRNPGELTKDPGFESLFNR